jgi:hypothetical protein
MPALPMAVVDSLQRQVAYYQLPGMQAWQTLVADPQSLINRLAFVHDNRQLRENPVRFEEIFYRIMAHEWVDEISTTGLFSALTWTVPIGGYDSYVPYNVVNIDRPGHQKRLDAIMAGMPRGHEEMKVRKMFRVFRNNPLSISGQTLFHATHNRPAVYGGTFSNLLAPNWADPAAPTLAEAMAVLDEAAGRFGDIGAVDVEVVDTAATNGKLVVIAHNAATEAIFKRLRDRENIAVADSNVHEANPYKGTFDLLRDRKPTTGQEHYLEIVYTGADAKPVILVLDKDYEPAVWTDNRVPNGYVATGGWSMFGMAPGAPWSVLQVRPT